MEKDMVAYLSDASFDFFCRVYFPMCSFCSHARIQSPER